MRRLAAVLILLALPGSVSLQEDDRVRDLLQKLDDDSIAVRAAAATALAQLGASVVPALKKAAMNAGPELSERLAEVLHKIQERERLAAILPPPSRISLSAVDRPLREVFEALSKQTTTPIDYSNVPENAKVTISIDKLPLWKALAELCRASGKVMADFDRDHVVISPEPYVALPGKMTDLFHITLQRLDLSSKGVFGQPDRFEHFNSVFRIAWERGVRPYRINARLTDLVDESGNEILAAGDIPDFDVSPAISADSISNEFMLDTERGPGPQATRIAKLKAEFEFEFPLKYTEVKLPIDGDKLPVKAECPEFSVRLLRFERLDGLTAVIVLNAKTAFEGDLGTDAVFLKDADGKTYAAQLTGVAQGGDNEIPYQFVFPQAPENAKFTSIEIRVPTEIHRERIEVELRDLPLK